MTEKISIQNNQHVDYKDVQLLRNFINPHGKIIPCKRNGIGVKSQRKISRAIKRARFMGLLPYSIK